MTENGTIYVVTSRLYGHKSVVGVFSTQELAERFCLIENSAIEDFRKQDDIYYYKPYIIDEKRVPDDQCYKKYWDYQVNINKDVQEYGEIKYVTSGTEMVHINKLQGLEVYNDEFIYCRSYVSKQEAENIANEQWQMFQQKEFIKTEVK